MSNPLFVDAHGNSLKFYIPRGEFRKQLKDTIQLYGGQVTTAKHEAYLSLVPPNEKTEATNVYSMDYIQECIKAQSLLDPLPFRLNLNGNNKTEREVFSFEDHKILKDFIQATNWAVGGNKLYETLALKHPNHTWQSWKDYAMTKLIPGLGPNGVDKLRSAKTSQEDQALPLSQMHEQHATKTNMETRASNDESFTQQDLLCLTNYLSSTLGNVHDVEYYKGLELIQPHHSAQLWHHYATQVWSSKLGKEFMLQQDKENEPNGGLASFVHEKMQRHEVMNQEFKRYFGHFQAFCSEFDLWDMQDILLALKMSSGSFQLARKVLNVGFKIDSLPIDIQNKLFDEEADELLMDGNMSLIERLVQLKGEENVKHRQVFLLNLIQPMAVDEEMEE